MSKDVSDGCFYHVCLKGKPEILRAANTQALHNVLKKVADGKASYEAEMKESARVGAAQDSILADVKCALNAIHTMPKLSELMSCDDWELRLLLCKVEQEVA